MNVLYTSPHTSGYRLSMQAIADELQAASVPFQAKDLRLTQCLKGVRMYRRDCTPAQEYLWVLEPRDLCPDLEGQNLVVLGQPDSLPANSSAVLLDPSQDPARIYNLLQEIFEKFVRWDRDLHWAIYRKNPLEAMMTISLEIFENPVFLHDKDFYVLTCPRWLPGMLNWDKDPRTGRDMVPLDLINTFRVNEEYRHTLTTTQSALFSANIRDYRILYANLWNDTAYIGRICVDEIQRPLRSSDYQHLDHLAALTILCMGQQKLLWLPLGSEMDAFFTNLLSGKEMDHHKIDDMLRFLGWSSSHRYAILKVVSDQENYRAITPATLFGYIEAQIAQCHALLFQQEIVVIVNLTASGATTSGVLSSLAYILRDGMFKIGISSEIPAFQSIHYGYTQASVALEYGRRSNSMIWYYHFRDYALQFVLDSACVRIPSQLLISEKLLKLLHYDQENNTDLYHTAEVYLRHERNAVVTAKELFIHRSTLFYRLNRIEAVSGIDFDNEQERLYLQLSFHMRQP